MQTHSLLSERSQLTTEYLMIIAAGIIFIVIATLWIKTNLFRSAAEETINLTNESFGRTSR